MSKFLPTKDFHIFEITELSPEAIKQSIKNCKKDRKQFKQTTALNFIANQFGIEKGFSDYQRWYDEELTPFLEKNGMTERINLINNPHNDDLNFFTYRKISDRLYHSDKKNPKRIFVGSYSNIRFFQEKLTCKILDFPMDSTAVAIQINETNKNLNFLESNSMFSKMMTNIYCNHSA